jgi:hypothetical protein
MRLFIMCPILPATGEPPTDGPARVDAHSERDIPVPCGLMPFPLRAV